MDALHLPVLVAAAVSMAGTALHQRVRSVPHACCEANHERLSELWQAADPDLLLVNAHDPLLLSLAQHRQTRRAPET
ncbi:hypothetical protein [Streptomyces sp. NPDC056464]|uniref:hypothetical protein n=1 Tax=Streptomyces sp. NPDC056464 TaxID=3345828 RepID=UPI0036A05181